MQYNTIQQWKQGLLIFAPIWMKLKNSMSCEKNRGIKHIYMIPFVCNSKIAKSICSTRNQKSCCQCGVRKWTGRGLEVFILTGMLVSHRCLHLLKLINLQFKMSVSYCKYILFQVIHTYVNDHLHQSHHVSLGAAHRQDWCWFLAECPKGLCSLSPERSMWPWRRCWLWSPMWFHFRSVTYLLWGLGLFLHLSKNNFPHFLTMKRNIKLIGLLRELKIRKM